MEEVARAVKDKRRQADREQKLCDVDWERERKRKEGAVS